MVRWLVLLVAGCSLAVDTEPLIDGECPDGEKVCGTECVDIEPAFGCGALSCSPCVFPNTTPFCGPSGECTFAVCDTDFRDCDGLVENGCEADVRFDPNSCGDCGVQCSDTVANAEPDCSNSRCAVRVCYEGFGDCNEDGTDGCERSLLDDAENCGACGVKCADAEQCVAGVCTR